MSHPQVELYYSKSCPYCINVLTYLKSREITVPLKDVSEPQVSEELIGIGGKRQVPCLVIEGKALYESDDIVQWFEDNWE